MGGVFSCVPGFNTLPGDNPDRALAEMAKRLGEAPIAKFARPAGPPPHYKCQRIAMENNFGAFVVYNGLAVFRQKSAKECRAGLFPMPEATTYVRDNRQMAGVPGGGKERSAHVSVGVAKTDRGDPLYVKRAAFPIDLARALGVDPRRIKLLGVRDGSGAGGGATQSAGEKSGVDGAS